jgi:hypothetical protein
MSSSVISLSPTSTVPPSSHIALPTTATWRKGVGFGFGGRSGPVGGLCRTQGGAKAGAWGRCPGAARSGRRDARRAPYLRADARARLGHVADRHVEAVGRWGVEQLRHDAADLARGQSGRGGGGVAGRGRRGGGKRGCRQERQQRAREGAPLRSFNPRSGSTHLVQVVCLADDVAPEAALDAHRGLGGRTGRGLRGDECVGQSGLTGGGSQVGGKKRGGFKKVEGVQVGDSAPCRLASFCPCPPPAATAAAGWRRRPPQCRCCRRRPPRRCCWARRRRCRRRRRPPPLPPPPPCCPLAAAAPPRTSAWRQDQSNR